FVGAHESSTIKTDFFLNCKKQRDRWMRSILSQQFQGCRQYHRCPGSIVSTQSGGGIGGTNDVALQYGLATGADRNRIDMCHQQPTWSTPGSGQIDDQIPRLPTTGNALLC